MSVDVRNLTGPIHNRNEIDNEDGHAADLDIIQCN